MPCSIKTRPFHPNTKSSWKNTTACFLKICVKRGAHACMTTYDWSPPYVALIYVGLGLGLLVTLILARHLARAASAKSWLLLFLRAGVLGLLAALLVNPVRVRQNQLPPTVPEVTYLVDCSRSMALDQPFSRLDLVKDAIARSKRHGAKDAQPRTNLFRFGV